MPVPLSGLPLPPSGLPLPPSRLPLPPSGLPLPPSPPEITLPDHDTIPDSSEVATVWPFRLTLSACGANAWKSAMPSPVTTRFVPWTSTSMARALCEARSGRAPF